MAEIVQNNKSKGATRLPKVILDMTPMEDMAFLLLTFFVLAATLNKPKVIEIFYPQKSTVKIPLDQKNVLTILLGHDENQVYYYQGKFKNDSLSVKKDLLFDNGDGKVPHRVKCRFSW